MAVKVQDYTPEGGVVITGINKKFAIMLGKLNGDHSLQYIDVISDVHEPADYTVVSIPSSDILHSGSNTQYSLHILDGDKVTSLGGTSSLNGKLFSTSNDFLSWQMSNNILISIISIDPDGTSSDDVYKDLFKNSEVSVSDITKSWVGFVHPSE